MTSASICKTQVCLSRWYTKQLSTRKLGRLVLPSVMHSRAQLQQRWENVPITLETVTPTFGLQLPTLLVWKLSHVLPPGDHGSGGARRHRRILPDEDDLDFDMDHQSTVVTSKGNVNATFRVPGTTTIPSDEEQHKVTIAELDLEATMSWVCIPKGDTRVHLKVNQNAS